MSRKRLIKAYKGGMRNYEIAFILNQSLSAEGLKKKIDQLKEIAEELGATINHIASTALKSYAYPIASTNNKKGYYACIYASMKPENMAELVRKSSIQDDVLRILVVLSDPRKQTNGIFANNYEDDSRPKQRFISYDDPNLLIKFLGERGRIEARKQSMGKRIGSGVAARQRVLSREIKRSRFLSLLPYIEE